jgi:hypothetical protein
MAGRKIRFWTPHDGAVVSRRTGSMDGSRAQVGLKKRFEETALRQHSEWVFLEEWPEKTPQHP